MTVAVELVLFLAAWLGHAFLWTVLLNVVFSRPYHRRLLGAFRLFVAVVVLVVPPVLLLAYGAPPVSWLEETVRLRPPGPVALTPITHPTAISLR